MRAAGTRGSARLLFRGMMSYAEAQQRRRPNLFKAHSYARSLNRCIMLYGLLQAFYLPFFGSGQALSHMHSTSVSTKTARVQAEVTRVQAQGSTEVPAEATLQQGQ